MPSFPVHQGLQVDDKGGVTWEKPSPRTSIFSEHEDVDLPRVWGRDSQSRYNGIRSLGGLEIGRIGGKPLPVDVGYEIPERYGGRESAYGEDIAQPLAGNNNTWVPPAEQEGRICGLGRKWFWALGALLCLLVVGAAVGGVVAAVASSKKSVASAMSNGALATVSVIPASTQTSMSSLTSITTLPNGSVIITTQIITSIQIVAPQTAPQTTTKTPSSSASSSSATIETLTFASSTSASVMTSIVEITSASPVSSESLATSTASSATPTDTGTTPTASNLAVITAPTT